MMFVEGQGKSVLEELEEEKGAPQKYTDLVEKLKFGFNTFVFREFKMVSFESKTRGVRRVVYVYIN